MAGWPWVQKSSDSLSNVPATSRQKEQRNISLRYVCPKTHLGYYHLPFRLSPITSSFPFNLSDTGESQSTEVLPSFQKQIRTGLFYLLKKPGFSSRLPFQAGHFVFEPRKVRQFLLEAETIVKRHKGSLLWLKKKICVARWKHNRTPGEEHSLGIDMLQLKHSGASGFL